MHSTRVVLGRGTVTTHHGQTRILKRLPDMITYIQKAVKAGTYRTNEEIRDMNQKLQETPTDLKRLRWNLQRGSKIQDYPIEYEIMTLNPPTPFQPLMPLKHRRKMVNQYMQQRRPTDKLARNYLNHLHTQQDGPATSEEYYRRLLGSNRVPKVDSAMGSKSAALNKAYAFAVKQHQVMRTENLSERDALERVEELLQQEDKEERHASRAVAQELEEKRSKVSPNSGGDVNANSKDPTVAAKQLFPKGTLEPPEDMEEDTYISLLYSDKQRAFEGMISWTHRLQAVPYSQWTVGASVALDHWIAKRVLGLAEETWLDLLEGIDPNLTSRGRDIVMARHALFPETMLDADSQDDMDASGQQGGEGDTIEDDIDQLLATLGAWNKDGKDKDGTAWDWKSEEDGGDMDDKVLKLTEQLQEWRAKNVEAPYNNWSEEQKGQFTTWLEDYVVTLTPEAAIDKVDMEGTRNALLASPPQSQEDSDHFWQSIRDETAAEVFLQRLLDAGPPEDATKQQAAFWELDYEEQLERLVNLGAIREIADEYAKESDRSKFLARYGDYLLQGIKLDHLVPDPNGPITGADIGARLAKQHQVSKEDRFRIEKIPFGSDNYGTDASQRARDLYRAWNKFKAGRAHYEEKMFKKGLLGLQYEDEKKKK